MIAFLKSLFSFEDAYDKERGQRLWNALQHNNRMKEEDRKREDALRLLPIIVGMDRDGLPLSQAFDLSDLTFYGATKFDDLSPEFRRDFARHIGDARSILRLPGERSEVVS